MVFSNVRASIALQLIRHAESRNNEMYRDAHYIYRGGTPEFDQEGWTQYVGSHRSADPFLSEKGTKQADHLASYLVPHLENQASHPVRIVVSPMRRTLETIRPTLERLQRQDGGIQPKVHITVCGFYHESEGCHIKDKPEEGMNPMEIRELLKDCVHTESDIDFVGFPESDRGWYLHGRGAETRVESESRAAKFYLWLCEYLDGQLAKTDQDLFDAGVQIQGEEEENEHDKHATRKRRRRTALLIGHGDFMSLVMKRLVAGYGHYVETEGIPHRSAFTHFNTGISEFEYFGHGRFLVMGCNQTPHFDKSEYEQLRSGGSLKDGWSYLVPPVETVLSAEVDVLLFSDEVENHVQEQAVALRALYLSSSKSLPPGSSDLKVEKEESDTTNTMGKKDGKNENDDDKNNNNDDKTLFVVKRGLQVVGVATYSTQSGVLTDVAIRPSSMETDEKIGETLMGAVKDHAKKFGRSDSLIVHPRSADSRSLFESMGFLDLQDDDDENENNDDVNGKGTSTGNERKMMSSLD